MLAFAVLFTATQALFSNIFNLLMILSSAAGWFSFYDSIPEPALRIWIFYVERRVIPFIITLLIFIRLSKIYRTR